MRILPDLPDLQILPVDALRPHEVHEEKRSSSLAEALRREGVLRNPPIVLRMSGIEERYVVLDGANRTAVFRQLGMPHVLAQVVHPGDNHVGVETWNHAVLDVPPEELLAALRAARGIELIESEPDRAAADLSERISLAYISLRDGGSLSVAGDASDLRTRIEGLHALVRAWQGHGRTERTNAGSAPELARAFPTAAGLVVFLAFQVQDVVDAVSRGLLLPAGLTRFVVSPRALRVNYPLEALTADLPREQKEQALTRWVQDKVVAHRVRYYAEATYLFDE